MSKITPFLWFDTQAEEAANFYVSVFPRSKILNVSHYLEVGPGPKGSVMTVELELDGQRFIALNGGPEYKFTEAISFTVQCKTQAEVDHFWDALGAGGEHGPCGWLKDGVATAVGPMRGIAEVLTAPRSSWQNPFAERVIGTIRRELLDHVIVLNEGHLRRRLHSYLRYYHGSRTHLALEKDAPEPRAVEPPEHGRVVALPHVGGLHHRYVRRAA